MTALRALILSLALATPAVAQEAEIHAPCLAARDVTEVDSALRAAGWGETTSDAGISAVAQQFYIVAGLPSYFDSPERVEAYTGFARHWFAQRSDTMSPLFARGDVFVIYTGVGGDWLQCVFAAQDLPEAEAILRDHGTGPFATRDEGFGSGFSHATVPEPGEPGDATPPLTIDAFRLEAAPEVAPLLSGRVGLIVTIAFPPSGT